VDSSVNAIYGYEFVGEFGLRSILKQLLFEIVLHMALAGGFAGACRVRVRYLKNCRSSIIAILINYLGEKGNFKLQARRAG
jgi:hypothetical protein